MVNNLCVFAKYKWWMGYKQYPTTNNTDIYSELFTKAGKQKELIVVSVKDNKVLYAYRYKTRKGFVWLCFQHDKICDDFENLFSFLFSILNSMAKEGIGIITQNKTGKYKLNNINFKDPKLKGKLKDFLQRINNTLDSLLSAHSVSLPQSGGGDITDEIIEYELKDKGSAYFVERIKERYTVILLQESKTDKRGKTVINWDDIIVYSIIGCFILLVLFNYIAPWFIPSTWPKIALLLTGLGSYFVIDAIDENSKRKHKGILGWLGAIAILFSTVLTIYGLYNHFSPDTEEKSKLTPTVKLEDVVPSKDEQGILAVTNTSFKEESHKTRKRGVTVNADYEIDNDNIALQICSKESVSFDELKMISESSKVSPGTKKKALTISNLYISVFNTTNHSLRHFKKLYSNGKRENSFSKEQIEILEWFFALSENEQKKWEDSDCTSNNFEEFKNNVERLIQNN